MKNEPRYGYYPWWPQDGDDWLHPEDVELARNRFPSMRIYRRECADGDYEILHYGDEQLRILPSLWQEVDSEGFEIGDWVEVLSRGLRNTPRTGTIREMVWDGKHRGIRYQILENDQPIAEQYTADDLRHIEPTSPYSPAPSPFS